MREQSVSLAKRSRRARSLAAYFLFARVRILADSRRMMYHALRDTKRSSNAWRLRFIVLLCDTICCGAFFNQLFFSVLSSSFNEEDFFSALSALTGSAFFSLAAFSSPFAFSSRLPFFQTSVAAMQSSPVQEIR